jgi:hypothetical protein
MVGWRSIDATTALRSQSSTSTVPSSRATATIAEDAPGPATVTLLGRDTGGGTNRATVTVTVP